ncbi:unnamed protein product [Cuscuta europaea]|uniref:Secreted protein n=1 Tax=Cuscuta europaea TaxID=41803 RepID=A0A9P1EL76_CUSEU|nr:unnamed protein product [Cuscuta europaea]
MCPLRIILIFLSATLSGFFVLRNNKSPPNAAENKGVDNESSAKAPTNSSSPCSAPSRSKVSGIIREGFWTWTVVPWDRGDGGPAKVGEQRWIMDKKEGEGLERPTPPSHFVASAGRHLCRSPLHKKGEGLTENRWSPSL